MSFLGGFASNEEDVVGQLTQSLRDIYLSLLSVGFNADEALQVLTALIISAQGGQQ